MQVLVVLQQAAGRVVPRDDLIARCWEGRIVGEDAINRVIWRLRRFSEADGGANVTIETVPKVGYRLLRKTERFKALMRDAGFVKYWRARGWPDLCHPVGADDFACQ